MNSDLLKNNFLLIKNFIDEERAIKLYKEFSLCDKFYKFGGDPQAPNSAAIYNYLPSLEILCEKTKEVSDIIGETVLPTYTYSRIYRNGSILDEHVDRPACEISLTLHLFGDKPWAIWIKTPEMKSKCVTLNPGDALLYLGCIAPHKRDEYVGNEYAQFFLHYVRSRGKFSKFYFDKHKENIDSNDIIEDYKKMGWNSNYKIENKNTSNYNFFNNKNNFIPLGEDDSPILVNSDYVKNKNSTNKISEKSLKSYIKIFDNILPEELCDHILNEYVNNNSWEKTLTGSGHNPNARNCSVIPISQSYIIEENPDIRKEIDECLYDAVSHSLKLYENEFPEFDLEIREDSGYELLRYNEGEFYVEHSDSYKESPRALSCIISLNEDYEGGEISFFSRELTYKLKKGSVIMFPSNFMYPHEIRKVTNGTRYSIITWLV